MTFASSLHSKSAIVKRFGLLRQARWRREEIGEIIVKGREQIEIILHANSARKFEHILVSNKFQDYEFLDSLRLRCRKIHKVEPSILYGIVYQSRPVLKTEFLKEESSVNLLEDVSVSDSLMLGSMVMPRFELPNPLNLVLCLDGVIFPENVGTLIRTAASLGGVDAIVSTTSSCDFHGWKVIEASKGYGFEIPKFQIRDSLTSFVNEHNLSPLIGNSNVAMSHGTPLSKPTIVIVGNERHGPSDAALSLPNAVHIRIPTSGEMTSLNAAVAGGLLLQMAKK